MNSHDVRRLRVCCFCNSIQVDLPQLPDGRNAHASCLVKAEGWSALAALPKAEIDKATIYDLLQLRINKLTEFEALLKAARTPRRPASASKHRVTRRRNRDGR